MAKAKKSKKDKKVKDYFCWVIAYIDSSMLDKVQRDLARYPEFAEVEAYIPTVKILKKQFKAKDFFEEVPLLFNYGFFKIPRKFAVHTNFLENLQRNVGCIYGWVKDPANVMGNKPRLSEDNKLNPFRDNHISVATATSEEVSRLLKLASEMGAHTAEDIGMLKPGDLITLRGYPWDGVSAEFVEVDSKKKQVKVKIRIFETIKDTMVSFDNVFFTVYHNKSYDDSISTTDSLDEEVTNSKLNKSITKKYNNG